MLEAILADADDRAFLKALREETTLLVLMVRVDNQEKNDLAKEKMDERINWEWNLFHPTTEGSDE